MTNENTFKHGNTVWDTKENREVSIDNINLENKDNRYISILTGTPISIVKEHTKTNKHNTKYKVRKHIANKTTGLTCIHRGESDVHKAAKEFFKNSNIVLNIPLIQYLYTTHCSKIYLDIIKKSKIQIMGLLSIEEKDENSSYIPDLKVLVNIDGVIQPLYIEIRYTHPVDKQKKETYIKNKTNCIEIDIREIEDYKNSPEEIFNAKLKDIIQNNCKWISNFNSLITIEWL